ncbi:MAG: acyl-CoA thioesterase [Gammaproteobacteria bacterium RIFCSPHIGHO2_12_FULL_41_15]|nr:MAG: acyl-CoA thioesterase [Gammaproteobacteria bacterium RIFCSPHIGHO2_12_FULL_41_15]
MNKRQQEPLGELQIRIMAMPENTNAHGDIFGGWILSIMDLAGSSIAQKESQSRVVTIAVESMSFLSPVKVGDFVCCYGELLKIGRTSMRVKLETWVVNQRTGMRRQVTEGVYTYVSVNEAGQPIPVKRKLE